MSVRVGLSRVEDAEDDAEPTPMMTDVAITPQTGTPFRHDVFPDTGCVGVIQEYNPTQFNTYINIQSSHYPCCYLSKP